MIDTAKSDYPSDMMRAADRPPSGVLGNLTHDVMDCVDRYIHEQPASAVLWALGIGLFLGWKLKP